MPISDDLKEVYATAPIDNYYVETISLEHPAFLNGIQYLTNKNGGWTGYTETGSFVAYDYLPFATIPPAAADQAQVTLQVAIDNASQALMQQLEDLSLFPSEPIAVVYRVYLSSDPYVLQNSPPLTLDVAGVTATQDIISFSATLTNLRNRPFPAELYTVVNFPGLQR